MLAIVLMLMGLKRKMKQNPSYLIHFVVPLTKSYLLEICAERRKKISASKDLEMPFANKTLSKLGKCDFFFSMEM